MRTEHPLVFRSALRPGDEGRVRHLVASTGFFSPEEVAIAGELVTETLQGDPDGDYRFILVDAGDTLAGYACFGRIPGTLSSWDLYWIAVATDRQGRGLGRDLLLRSEEAIRAAGGSRIYVDTSSRAQYAPTREFYRRCGYGVAAELPDFFAPGDGKVIFVRVLEPC